MKPKDQQKLQTAAMKVVRPGDRPHVDRKPKDAATAALLDHVHAVHSNTLAQLDILRKTRGQRTVGTVTVPAHLQASELFDASGVEMRGGLSPLVRGE